MAVTPFKSSDNFNMAGFNEKITEADNTYVAKTGGSMSGALSMGNNKITDVASPVNNGDVATKGYVDGFSKIQYGSYTGTGVYGVNNKNSLTFNFEPKCLIIRPSENISSSNPQQYTFLWIYGMKLVPLVGDSNSDMSNNKVILSDKTISWYCDMYSSSSVDYQFNVENIEYRWICFG